MVDMIGLFVWARDDFMQINELSLVSGNFLDNYRFVVFVGSDLLTCGKLSFTNYSIQIDY